MKPSRIHNINPTFKLYVTKSNSQSIPDKYVWVTSIRESYIFTDEAEIDEALAELNSIKDDHYIIEVATDLYDVLEALESL